MQEKPYLFLDFDRTLFDTEQYYRWLGEPRKQRNQELIDGTRPLPDFSQFLFPDAVTFLESVKEKFTLVVLSFVQLDYSPDQTTLQRKKIAGTNIEKYFAEIIVTTNRKGKEGMDYLVQNGDVTRPCYFIDDPLHLSDMKTHVPSTVCILIDRVEQNTGIEIGALDKEYLPDKTVHSLSEAAKVLLDI